jgi:hypothetical protein
MLIVRRHAPAGTFFKDPIPAGAVYTVAGTAYMVIVAFVFFIAFESYGGAKADAEEEATASLGMFHTVTAFGPADRAELQGQMICYAREVISDEWPAMRGGRGSSVVDARVSAMEEAGERIAVNGAKQTAAFEHWFALNEDRRQGRQGRIGKAEGLVPPVIWLILIIGAVVVIGSVALSRIVRSPRLRRQQWSPRSQSSSSRGWSWCDFSTSHTRTRAAASNRRRWRGRWRRWT